MCKAEDVCADVCAVLACRWMGWYILEQEEQYLMKSTKVLNPRLITPKTMHEHMIMQHATVDTIKSTKTGTSLQDYGIIELWQKYSSTLHACSVTTQSLLLQVKDHQSSRDCQQKVHATNTCPVTTAN